jgi:hypothetical protein
MNRTGFGICIALAFFGVAITWIGCEHFEERQCREKEWRWDGERCLEP